MNNLSAELMRQELEIVAAIDDIRDTAPGPPAMFSGIVEVVMTACPAEFAWLYLLNPETGQLELRVFHEHPHTWRRFSWAVKRDHLKELLRSEGVLRLPATELFTELPGETLKLAQLQAAVISIAMQTRPLGILLLARHHTAFTTEEVQLLTIAESHIDSAIIQAYRHHELAQRNKELETIYHFDHIRDQNLPFNKMLNVVVQDLCASVSAEMGFVMLYDQAGEQLEMRAHTHGELLDDPAHYQLFYQLANQAIQEARLLDIPETAETHCSAMCVPLILRQEIIGVFGAVHGRGKGNFNATDKRLLRAIVSQMDTAILESLEQRRLRQVLGRSVDQHVLAQLLAQPHDDPLHCERQLLTVLYVDLRGSTQLAEQVAPELLVIYLNDYLRRMSEIILSHRGTLDKFIGDEVMALFGAPLPQPDHALRAIRVGLAMQREYLKLAQHWQPRGVEALGIGVGIATGELLVGEIGYEHRTDYTVIGCAANLGARICASAKPGEVLISPATYQLAAAKLHATAIPNQKFKGIAHPLTVYRAEELLDFNPHS
ncbi:MAG: adenylate/guanylate cyclase domain-containing protein [Chloroflexota bacterium]|nr:adenylate/guanylate cyclase domain-containing protein [Chloroflexota bacterium]